MWDSCIGHNDDDIKQLLKEKKEEEDRDRMNYGGGAEVDFYDRNRLYVALGYKFSNTGQIQVGYMQQHTNVVNKGQFQLSLNYNF